MRAQARACLKDFRWLPPVDRSVGGCTRVIAIGKGLTVIEGHSLRGNIHFCMNARTGCPTQAGPVRGIEGGFFERGRYVALRR
jgi:hypothetical protein